MGGMQRVAAGWFFLAFFSKICDEIAVFALFSFLCRYIFACILKTNPMGLSSLLLADAGLTFYVNPALPKD